MFGAKFSKSGVYFALTAYFNSEWPPFKCSIATMWLVATVLDSTGLARCASL